MSSDKDAKRQANILSLHELLRKIASEPAPYLGNKILMQALKSQHGLAKYNDEEEGISSTSLNTLKRHSEHWLAGGYVSLERARCLANEKTENYIRTAKHANKRTKQALDEKIKNLNTEVKQSCSDNLLLAGALRMALKYMREYARDSNNLSLIKRSERDYADIIRMFSLASQPLVLSGE